MNCLVLLIIHSVTMLLKFQKIFISFSSFLKNGTQIVHQFTPNIRDIAKDLETDQREVVLNKIREGIKRTKNRNATKNTTPKTGEIRKISKPITV